MYKNYLFFKYDIINIKFYLNYIIIYIYKFIKITIQYIRIIFFFKKKII